MPIRRFIILLVCFLAALTAVPAKVCAIDGVESVIAKTEGSAPAGRWQDINVQSAESLPGPSEPMMKLSLDQCVKMAVAENSKLRAAGYGVDAAVGQVTEAKARGWPVMEYEFWAAPVPRNVDTAVKSFFSGDVAAWFKYKLVLGIPITAFGQLTAVRKLAESGVVAAKQNVLKERDQLIFDVKQIYYGILMGKEMQKLLEKAVSSLTSKINEEEAAENPSLSPFDQLKMKVFREEMSRRLDQVKTEMGLAYDGLKVQLGLDPSISIDLDRDSLEPEVVEIAKLEDYVNTSMDERPESRLIDVGVDAKRKLVTLEKLKLAPKMGVGFYFEIGRTHKEIYGLNATDDFNNPFNFTRAGVGLRLMGTLDFHGAYGRIKKAQAEYLKSLYEGRIGKEGLRLDAKKAYEKVLQLHDAVLSAKKSQSLSNQMMFLSKSNFELGIGEQEDYSEALQLVMANRGLYFKAVFDYNVALADLERKVGYAAYAHLTGRPNISVYDAFDIGEDIANVKDTTSPSDDELIQDEEPAPRDASQEGNKEETKVETGGTDGIEIQ